jgi:hypothetical protein
MVLSALPVFAVLPLMAMLRRPATWRDCIVVTLAAAVIGVDVYFLTNPYVLAHLIRRDPVLWSNLGNSTAMYSAGGSAAGVINAVLLVGVGTSVVLGLVGAAGAVALAARAFRVRREQGPAEVGRRAAGLLLAAPALLVAIQFIALAAGKPGEYARFAILPDALLAVEAVVAVATFVRRPAYRHAAFVVLALSTTFFGGLYLCRFVGDAGPSSTRMRAASDLAELPGALTVAVSAEPAPYSLPPVNLFTRQILLLPRGAKLGRETTGEPAVVVTPMDFPRRHWLDAGWWEAPRQRPGWAYGVPAPITWAGKTFEVNEVGPESRLGE